MKLTKALFLLTILAISLNSYGQSKANTLKWLNKYKSVLSSIYVVEKDSLFSGEISFADNGVTLADGNRRILIPWQAVTKISNPKNRLSKRTIEIIASAKRKASFIVNEKYLDRYYFALKRMRKMKRPYHFYHG